MYYTLLYSTYGVLIEVTQKTYNGFVYDSVIGSWDIPVKNPMFNPWHVFHPTRSKIDKAHKKFRSLEDFQAWCISEYFVEIL